jgi:hypothetical protein
MKRILFISALLFLCINVSLSATYYVDGSAGEDTKPGTKENPWRTINKANDTLCAGDTVIIRAGTYLVEDNKDKASLNGINPKNSGMQGKIITYSNYPGETVIFKGNHNASRAVNLDGKSYIRVTGLTFINMYQFLIIDNNAHHNEIDHCTFSSYRERTDGVPMNYRGSTIYHNSMHNWIHDNTFAKYGKFTTKDEGVLFELGIGTKSTDQSNYNTIENNHMYHGGHHVLGINTGRYNVVRNNYVHNESWYNGAGCEKFEKGLCGYRVMSMTGTPEYSGYTLLEGNRIAYGAQYGGPHLIGGASGSGISLGTSFNIVRYNDIFANALYGARFGASIAQLSSFNHLYNNTFYYNGHGADDDPYALKAYRIGLYFYGSSCRTMSDNVVKNNLFHGHWSRYNTKYRVITGRSDVLDCNTIENNCEECTDDPLFVNSDITNPMSMTLPDLRLRIGSPVINKGIHLTLTSGAGRQSTTLVVQDARYFQDGTWGSDLARSTLHADWIAIGQVKNVHKVASIDYETNTISLATPTSWADGEKVWLYKKSDGMKVLYDSAPDMGAHESTF